MVMRLYIMKAMKNQQLGNQRRQREAAEIWENRRAEIEALYVTGEWSQAQLAARYGVSQQAIARALARMGIPSKGRARAGDQNGRFKDGSQSTIYRTMVKKDACASCGTTENLCVHHKDEDHTNNVPSNLEVLCMSCHSSQHKQAWWDARRSAS